MHVHVHAPPLYQLDISVIYFYHQAGLEGLRLLVREQAATIEALRVEQAA